MLNLTPTLSMTMYSVASLTNLTLGSFFIANHIHQRWLKKFNLSLLDTNTIVKGLIVLLGFSIIAPEKLFYGSFSVQLGFLFIGGLLGLFYFKFESYFIKFFPRKIGISSLNINTLAVKSNNIKNALSHRLKINNSKDNNYSYISAGMVGVFEEILFRGFLTILCLSFPNLSVAIVFLILISVIFALSHINLGYSQVINKFILGVICLASFLFTNNICIAITTHCIFNLLAIKKIRASYHD